MLSNYVASAPRLATCSAKVGPLFECDAAFPKKINTEFVQVISRTHLKMKVWERGAGPTLACGTGTCALVVAAILNNHVDRCDVVRWMPVICPHWNR